MNKTLKNIAEKVKNLELKFQYMIFGGLLIFVFLINYLLVMQFEIGVIKKMNDNQLIIKNEIIRLEDHSKRVKQLKVDLTGFQKQLDSPQIKFRSKNDIPALMEELTKIAQTFDVHIEQLTPLKDTEELLLKNATLKYWAIPLVLQARAGYHSFGKWLNQLERDRFLLNVKKFSITGDENKTELHKIQAVLRVVVVEN